jgi:hypothetical protein
MVRSIVRAVFGGKYTQDGFDLDDANPNTPKRFQNPTLGQAVHDVDNT